MIGYGGDVVVHGVVLAIAGELTIGGELAVSVKLTIAARIRSFAVRCERVFAIGRI